MIRSKKWTPISQLQIGIPIRTLQEWCQLGKVRAQKIGKKWYVYLPDLHRQYGI